MDVRPQEGTADPHQADAGVPGHRTEPVQSIQSEQGQNRASTPEHSTTGSAASRPEEQEEDRDRSSSAPDPEDETDCIPGYFDEGITTYIEQYAPELEDDDPVRSNARAHKLWWNSGLPRWAFHNAMKRARRATAERQSQGQIRGSPMAYFFGVLAGAVADECYRRGRPLPRGWELESDPESGVAHARRRKAS